MKTLLEEHLEDITKDNFQKWCINTVSVYSSAVNMDSETIKLGFTFNAYLVIEITEFETNKYYFSDIESAISKYKDLLYK
jgi:hypothetical protein